MPAIVVALSAAVALWTAFVLRTRLDPTISIPILAAASGVLAWGVSLFLDGPSGGEVALAVVAMVILGPAHARIVLGAFGRRRLWAR